MQAPPPACQEESPTIAAPPRLTLLEHRGIHLQSARRVSAHVVPVRIRGNTIGSDATVPVLSDRVQGILASEGA